MSADASSEKALNRREANWPSVLFVIHIHVLSTYGLYLAFTDAKILTNLFCLVLVACALLGATTGAHRLWAHAAYKANTTLRVILMVFQTLLGQGSIYNWVKDHRLHHAHFGTDGDPYNHNKGLAYAQFFTHLQNLSPKQEQLINEIDMTDLDSDSIVVFQKRFYWFLYPIIFLLLPINAPVEYWGESILNSVFILGFLRYAFVLHGSWLINSANLIWGLKPGEKYPADTNLVFILTKSYWPQYHYLLPWDYKCGEFGAYGSGCSTTFIRVWAAMGWASDLRTLETDAVKYALGKSISTNSPISDCLNEAEKKFSLPAEHYLTRDK